MLASRSYSPECVEVEFSEVRAVHSPGPKTLERVMDLRRAIRRYVFSLLEAEHERLAGEYRRLR